ncbi:hypothetical protein ACFXD5_25130 [Streptomyces sp. NPDC059385]|uniref:hypothetical protein n=1 Tax=Streptomyces sp. NPDC059385 TaxID=3346817 RepID=UPI0036936E29
MEPVHLSAATRRPVEYGSPGRRGASPAVIVGAADALLEEGEAPTDLSPTPLTGPPLGPGLHPPATTTGLD